MLESSFWEVVVLIGSSDEDQVILLLLLKNTNNMPMDAEPDQPKVYVQMYQSR